MHASTLAAETQTKTIALDFEREGKEPRDAFAYLQYLLPSIHT